MRDISDTQADEVAAPKLAIDGQVEHGEVTNGMLVLKVNADRPDVLRLERWLLAYEPPFVPGFTLVDGFHLRLLGC